MKHRFASSLVVALVFTGPGCALLAGVDGERHLDAVDTTASSNGAGTGGGDGDAMVCSPALPPAPPAIKGAGGADVLTFALRTVDLGGPRKKVGFDLDGQCTCPGKTGCQEPAWAKADHCDDPDGRDNGSGNAFAAINQAFGAVISSIQLSDLAYNGKWSLLVQVSDYNGGDDDDQVEVALYTTPGTGVAPIWDGTDIWPVADSSLVDTVSLNQPVNKDPGAYVVNRVLVAHLPSATVVFQGPGVRLQIDLSSVVLSATLEAKDTGAVQLTSGTLAGSWTTPALFRSLSSLRVNNGMKLCVGDTYYHPVKSALCDEIDLSSTGSPGAECDALSFGAGFEASPALLGMPQPLTPPTAGCDAATDPATDVCGN